MKNPAKKQRAFVLKKGSEKGRSLCKILDRLLTKWKSMSRFRVLMRTLWRITKNTTKQPVVDRLIAVHPALKYLGFSLLMAYHYLMWFCPSSFFKTDLLVPASR